MSTKRTLSLQERLEVIKLNEAGKSSRVIAEQFKVGRTQIQSTIKRKAEFIDDFEKFAPLDKKRKTRPTGNEEINDLTLKWFQSATQRKINVDGLMLKKKALHFARDLNITTFSASNGESNNA